MANRTITIPLNGGYVSRRDPSDLNSGELQTASGVWYPPGDVMRAHVRKDRLSLATATARVKKLALALHDSGGTDRLLAYNGTKIQTMDPLGDAFTDLITGLNANAARGSFAHANDRWYFCNGYDRNYVIEADGSTRRAGMFAPQVQPTITLAAGSGTVGRATATLDSSGATNVANAIDGDTDTFAGLTLSGAGTATATWGTWASNTDAGRRIYVKWFLAGLQPFREGDTPDISDGNFGIGGGFDSGFNVTVLLEKSEDSGSNWSTVYEQTYSASTPQEVTTAVSVSANSNLVQFRAKLTYNSGELPATLRIYDFPIKDASDAATFSSTTGVYYAVSEFDQTRGLPGPIGPPSTLTAFSSHNH